ncbi:MAG: hypothetical protein NPIRA02_20080 [Nitrospirales bacterium]|nr:MAG: hypothetical protein NPIRA02_20080 [Nitrospirales bacterium]
MIGRWGVLKPLAVFASCLLILSPAWANPPKFPDRQSFSHVPGVYVEVLAYENMDEGSPTPEEMKSHVAKQLVKAGLFVNQGDRSFPKARSSEKVKTVKSQSLAMLGIHVRRTEDSAMFVAKIGSVAVTLQLFQRVKIVHNQHETHAITWSESQSILGGSKRPKKILEALDRLVEMFAHDFPVNRSPQQ